MPETVCFPYNGCDRSGIAITYYKTGNNLTISGWYDGCVGIDSTMISLGEFFLQLGIPVGKIKSAIKAMETE